MTAAASGLEGVVAVTTAIGKVEVVVNPPADQVLQATHAAFEAVAQ